MSASLVGSEMCIRDRLVPPRSVAKSAGAAAGPPGLRLQPTPEGAPAPSPVSYTHLTLPTICSV
eukprot:5282368-Alexandrium_andersonii.AAC.1